MKKEQIERANKNIPVRRIKRNNQKDKRVRPIRINKSTAKYVRGQEDKRNTS